MVVALSRLRVEVHEFAEPICGLDGVVEKSSAVDDGDDVVHRRFEGEVSATSGPATGGAAPPTTSTVAQEYEAISFGTVADDHPDDVVGHSKLPDKEHSAGMATHV